VVIRGEPLDPDAMAESAQRNFDVYGFYGASVLAETAEPCGGSRYSPPATCKLPASTCRAPV
jgi:hypothetical protein